MVNLTSIIFIINAIFFKYYKTDARCYGTEILKDGDTKIFFPIYFDINTNNKTNEKAK